MPNGPDYAEARMWFVWLRIFTPSDLADSMAVNTAVAQRFIRAATYHGIVEDCTPELNGYEEHLYQWKELPPGPTHHFTRTPPEITAPGAYSLAPIRGVPVRLIDNTARRNQMQGTGGGRLRIKNRDRAWERMQEAKMDRAERDRQKARNRSLGMQRAAEAMRNADDIVSSAFQTTGMKRNGDLPHKERTHVKKTQRKTK